MLHRNFIGDPGMILNIKDPMEIFGDKDGVFTLTKEAKDHGKSRQILCKSFHEAIIETKS